MAFSLIANTKSSPNAGSNLTTPAIDTTGANLIVINATGFSAASSTPTDNKSNTYTPLTQRTGGSVDTQLYYCANPTVGSNHTFTGIVSYSPIFVAAFSGASSTPADQENGAGSAGATSRTTGSITPSEDDELIIAGLGLYAVTSGTAIDSSMSITDSLDAVTSVNIGGAMAYKIQVAKAAINATWSWTGSSDAAAAIASFKIPSAVTGSIIII